MLKCIKLIVIIIYSILMLQYEVHVLDNILIKKQEFWEELSPSTV